MKPFKTVIKANIGDAHAMGNSPVTFIRQVRQHYCHLHQARSYNMSTSSGRSGNNTVNFISQVRQQYFHLQAGPKATILSTSSGNNYVTFIRNVKTIQGNNQVNLIRQVRKQYCQLHKAGKATTTSRSSEMKKQSKVITRSR